MMQGADKIENKYRRVYLVESSAWAIDGSAWNCCFFHQGQLRWDKLDLARNWKLSYVELPVFHSVAHVLDFWTHTGLCLFAGRFNGKIKRCQRYAVSPRFQKQRYSNIDYGWHLNGALILGNLGIHLRVTRGLKRYCQINLLKIISGSLKEYHLGPLIGWTFNFKRTVKWSTPLRNVQNWNRHTVRNPGSVLQVAKCHLPLKPPGELPDKEDARVLAELLKEEIMPGVELPHAVGSRTRWFSQACADAALDAGAKALCNEDVVPGSWVEEGPERVQEIMEWGPFDKEKEVDMLRPGQGEGGHSEIENAPLLKTWQMARIPRTHSWRGKAVTPTSNAGALFFRDLLPNTTWVIWWSR